MSTHEATIPLGLFLPDHLGDQLQEDVMVRSIEELQRESLPETLTGINSLISEVWGYKYDSYCMPLEEELRKGRINCLGHAALSALIGRVVGLKLIPTIENFFSSEDGIHAFITVTDDSGTIFKSDDNAYADATPYGMAVFSQGMVSTEEALIMNRTILDHDGVVQIRSNSEGSVQVLFDEQTQERYVEGEKTYRYTFFPGEEGLKSYLNTIEKISAIAMVRPPNTWPNQLMPRI